MTFHCSTVYCSTVPLFCCFTVALFLSFPRLFCCPAVHAKAARRKVPLRNPALDHLADADLSRVTQLMLRAIAIQRVFRVYIQIKYSQFDFDHYSDDDDDEDDAQAREKEQLRKRLFQQATRVPTLGMVLKRGAFRVHVQFGLQKRLKSAKVNLALRRASEKQKESSTKQDGAATNATRQVNAKTTSNSNSSQHKHKRSASSSSIQGQESGRQDTASASGGGAADGSSSSKSKSSKDNSTNKNSNSDSNGNGKTSGDGQTPSLLASLASEEQEAEDQRKLEEARKTVADLRRRRAKEKSDASLMYVPCCSPKKNRDGTSSKIGMSIFAQFPDRCNICGKQLRKKRRPPAKLVDGSGAVTPMSAASSSSSFTRTPRQQQQQQQHDYHTWSGDSHRTGRIVVLAFGIGIWRLAFGSGSGSFVVLVVFMVFFFFGFGAGAVVLSAAFGLG